MQVTLDRSNCGYYKLIQNETICTEESAELVVPDVCKDVGQILDVKGEICLVSKKISEGHIVINGVTGISIIYASDDGTVEETPLNIDFSQSKNLNDEVAEQFAMVQLSLKNIEVKTLNPRKFLVRIEPCSNLFLWTFSDSGVYAALPKGDYPKLECLKFERLITPAVSIKEKNFAISDEYTVPSYIPTNAKMISSATSLYTCDTAVNGSKLIYKLVAKTDAVFLDKESGKTYSCAFKTQVSQMHDCETKESLCDGIVIPVLKNSEITRLPERDNSQCYAINMSLMIQSVSIVEKCMSYISDIYSTKYPTEKECFKTMITGISNIRNLRVDLEGKLPAGISQNDVVYLKPSYASIELNNNKLSCSLRLRGMYLNPENRLSPLSVSIESCDDIENKDNNTIKPISFYVLDPDINSEGGISCGICLELGEYEDTTIESVQSVEIDLDSHLDKSRPFMVVVCSKKEKDLWNMAKKYGSTMEAIENANTIDGKFDKNIRPLVIPKV